MYLFKDVCVSQKMYPCVLMQNTIVSAHDKQKLNFKLIEELTGTVNLIESKKTYLCDYWYNLKYYVHSLHASY